MGPDTPMGETVYHGFAEGLSGLHERFSRIDTLGIQVRINSQ